MRYEDAFPEYSTLSEYLAELVLRGVLSRAHSVQLETLNAQLRQQLILGTERTDSHSDRVAIRSIARTISDSLLEILPELADELNTRVWCSRSHNA